MSSKIPHKIKKLKTKPRIIFIGASTIGLQCLEIMTQSPLYNVIGAITLPETFPISYRPEGVKNVLFADIKKYCASYDIKCIVMKQGMKESDLFEQVKTWSPDLFIVVGWYHIIPKSWLDLAPAYGLHASLLPDYSDGAALVPVSPWFREQTVAPLSANNLLKLKMRTQLQPFINGLKK